MTTVFERPFVVLLLVALIAWIILGQSLVNATIAPPVQNNHALQKHGAAAIAIAQKCLDGRNYHLFINPVTKRKAIVCYVDENKMWAVNIFEDWGDIVTQFPKEKVSTWQQVKNYMNNCSYEYKGLVIK